MTGKIVNLRQARKKRDRTEKAKAGDANATRFGEAKAGRTLREREAEKARRELDGHERET